MKINHSTTRMLLSAVIIACLGFVVYAETKPTEENTKNDSKQEQITADAVTGLPVYAPNSYWIGVRVSPVPDVLLSHFGVQEEGVGLVVVEQVVQDGPAEKAGLKRGDVILSFGGKDIQSLSDLVLQVAQAKETEQPLTVIRVGKKTDLKVTPELRPIETTMIPGPGGGFLGHVPPMPGMMRDPAGGPSNMKIGPEVWLGHRDPRKMMRDMEDYLRQMQGGVDGDQMLMIPHQENTSAESTFSSQGKSLQVTSQTDKDGNTVIRVKKIIRDGKSTEEQTWEVKSLDELPEDIRGEVEGVFPK